MAKQKTSLSDKRLIAHELYMRTEMTQKEIALQAGVGSDTISDWVRKGNWKELKAANSVTRAQVINNTLMQIKELQDEINGREKKYPTPKESDTMIKMSNLIRDLDKSLSLPDYISVCTEFIRYLSEVKPTLAKDVADSVNEFVQIKARQTTR